MGHLKKKAFSYKYMAANEDETLLLPKQKNTTSIIGKKIL